VEIRTQAHLQVGSPSGPAVPTLTDTVRVHQDDIEQVLIPREAIQEKCRELGERITEDYRGLDLLLVGVLKGAFVFMADLARHIHLPMEFDFMAVSSYGAATQTSGVVRILKDLDHEIQGRHVLLVEDIVDSGLTLSYLLRMLRTRRPASLEVCALMVKTQVQQIELPIRYRGFDIPPVFVVGYGLDYGERFRNLPFVGTLRPEVYRDAVS
jgi:hypoxanthine phosphoribosyltransferase